MAQSATPLDGGRRSAARSASPRWPRCPSPIDMVDIFRRLEAGPDQGGTMCMMIKLALHKGDLARGKIVNGANHTNLILGYHSGQDRRCVLQALGVVAHVGDNGALL